MNAKISVFVICVEVITYLLLGNLHDCTFNKKHSVGSFLLKWFVETVIETIPIGFFY